jgi:hypothetical protein
MIFEHSFLLKYLKNRKAEPTKLSRLFTFKSLYKQKERGLRKEDGKEESKIYII